MQKQSTGGFFPEYVESQEELTIGDRIREARRRRGLTQTTLAAMMGVHRVVVCTWERSHQLPNLTSLQKIRRALGCSIQELIGQ